MYKILTFLAFFLLGIAVFLSHTASSQEALKIVGVHSYSPFHVCTSPQVYGFNERCSALIPGFDKYNSLNYYMNTKTVDVDINSVSSFIIQEIYQENPKFVFTTDDDAFRYVGLSVAKNFKVYASGLNKKIEDYKKEIKADYSNIVAVEEVISLEQLFILFEKCYVTYNNFYLITETPEYKTPTSFYIEQNYLSELNGRGNIEFFPVKDTHDLKNTLLELNRKPQGVIVLVSQRLRNEDGGLIDKEGIARIVVAYNKKHLEVSGNPEFVRSGISICCAPSFRGMGELLANQVQKYVLFNEFSPLTIKAHSELWVNKKRLDELGMSFLYNRNPLLIFGAVEQY